MKILLIALVLLAVEARRHRRHQAVRRPYPPRHHRHHGHRRHEPRNFCPLHRRARMDSSPTPTPVVQDGDSWTPYSIGPSGTPVTANPSATPYATATPSPVPSTDDPASLPDDDYNPDHDVTDDGDYESSTHTSDEVYEDADGSTQQKMHMPVDVMPLQVAGAPAMASVPFKAAAGAVVDDQTKNGAEGQKTKPMEKRAWYWPF